MPVHSYARGSLPVAVLLLYYSDTPDTIVHPDNDTRLPSRKVFLDFVSAQGKGGLAEYYRDISRGYVDLTGSDVFGWWKMGWSYANDSGKRSGAELMTEGERVAREHGVDLAYYRGGIVIFTNGNSTAGSSQNHRKAIPFHLGGPWWASEDGWRVCNRCNVVSYTKSPGASAASCAAGPGGHAYGGGAIYSRDFAMHAHRDSVKVFRRCSKCQALAGEEQPGPCANGGQHEWDPASQRLFVPTFPERRGTPLQYFRLCSKCNCIVYGGTHLTERRDGNGNVVNNPATGQPIMDEVVNHTNDGCLVDSGGRQGKHHYFNIDVDYALSLRWWNEFHLALIAHEFGHTLGMAESWSAKLPSAPEKDPDNIYGDSYDLMSALNTWNTDEASKARFNIAPPILCAAGLLKLGWLHAGNYTTFYFGIGPQTMDVGNTLAQQLTPLSTQDPIPQPLDQEDTNYGSDGTQAVVIVSPNHTYTLEYRTRTGWDRNIPADTVLIHETRSNAMTGERGWINCAKCSTLWQASSSACPNGNVHVYVSTQGYLVPRADSGSDPAGQSGWASCSQCRTLYHTGQRGFCAGTKDGLRPHVQDRSFKVTMDSPPAAGNAGWLWCRKCQSLFLGGEQYGRRAGVCPTGGPHDSTGSGRYTLPYDSGSTAGREIGWRQCVKCHCLCYAEYNACGAGGAHVRDTLDPWSDYVLTPYNGGPKPAVYEYGWKRCTRCVQLVYTGGGGQGICNGGLRAPLPPIMHQIEQGREYGVATEAAGDKVNQPYSNLGRRCARCLAMVLVDWNGNNSADCSGGGGKHDLQGSQHYNLVSFNRDFTYLVGRDGIASENYRTYEFFPGDVFEDAKLGLKVTVGNVNPSTGKIEVIIHRSA